MMRPDISNGGFWGSGADFTFLTFLAFPDFPGKLGKVESKLIKVAANDRDSIYQGRMIDNYAN